MPNIYIERNLEGKIKKYLKRKEIIAIVGARQCGKTTLMKHIFNGLKNAKFITFEDREILEDFNNDVKLFIEKYVRGINFLFIDEFQYAKEGGKQLKFIYDTQDTKIIISGSSSIDLSVQGLKYLVGRIFIFTLTPLSFGEFLKYKDPSTYRLFGSLHPSASAIRWTNKAYDEYLLYGGYPEVALAKNEKERIEILKNIYNVYLLRDIREILQIADDSKLIKLIKALSLQMGNLINYQELSSLTEYSYPELKRYLNILRNTFICIESRPFFTNKRKELVKAPKFYFLDNGFRNVVIGNFQYLNERPDVGALNESFVASEIFKKEIQLNYWRTNAGAEVDFVVEKKSKMIPIEVKTKLNKPRYGKSMKNFISEYKSEKGFVLSRDYVDKAKVLGKNIRFLPLFLISRII